MQNSCMYQGQKYDSYTDFYDEIGIFFRKILFLSQNFSDRMLLHNFEEKETTKNFVSLQSSINQFHLKRKETFKNVIHKTQRDNSY